MEQYFKHKIRTKSVGEIIGWVIFGIICAIALGLLLGFGIMWLWNWLMPELFGLATITYWQAIGMFVLAKILFSSFGGGGSNSKDKWKSKKQRNQDECRDDFSKWKLYDKFWQEEGEKAYNDYVNKKLTEEE